MSFSQQLRSEADDLWAAQLDHPFIRGIGEGTLDPERFRFYVRQDYLFLIEYARVLALACAKAPTPDAMERFAALAHSTLHTELSLHREYAAEWEITGAELEAEPPAPETHAYTDFLLRTAALGEFAELVAALLPCMWGYSEIGQSLAAHGRPGQPLYAKWIDMYADDEFATLAGWCRDLCDEAAAGAGEAGRARMRDAFLASSRYELDFWDAAWRLTTRPPTERTSSRTGTRPEEP